MAIQLLLIAAFVFVMLVMAANYKKTKKRLMFIGGYSIEEAITPGGFMVELAELLNKEQADDKFELWRTGITSKNLHEVFERIEVQILEKGPDVVVMNFTASDIINWTDVTQKDFEAFLKSIVKRLLDSKIEVILCLPFITQQELEYCSEKGIDLSKYLLTISQVANQNNLQLVNIHDAALINQDTFILPDVLFAKEVYKRLVKS